MRKKTVLFVIFLSLSLSVFFSEQITPLTYADNQPTKSFGNTEPPIIATINWTQFWNLFNAHSVWDLECDNGSGWKSVKSDLKVTKNYTNDWTCKIGLIFNASQTGNYRLTFAIDLRVKNYTIQLQKYRYLIEYDRNQTFTYRVYFDWSDLASINGLTFTHGVTNINGTDCFWFRVRRDNVPKGAHLELDPTFGSSEDDWEGGGFYPIEDCIVGTVFTLTENGKATSITAYISKSVSLFTAQCMIYRHSDLALIGETGHGIISQTGYKTFTFDTPITLVADTDYVLVAWSDSQDGLCSLYGSANDYPNRGHTQSITFDVGNAPNPMVLTEHQAKIYTIYCTYSVYPTNDGLTLDLTSATYKDTKTLLTGQQDYKFVHNCSDIDGVTDISYAEIRLDYTSKNVILRATRGSGDTWTFTEQSDPNDYVNLNTAGSSDQTLDRGVCLYKLFNFLVTINPNWDNTAETWQMQD